MPGRLDIASVRELGARFDSLRLPFSLRCAGRGAAGFGEFTGSHVLPREEASCVRDHRAARVREV